MVLSQNPIIAPPLVFKNIEELKKDIDNPSVALNEKYIMFYSKRRFFEKKIDYRSTLSTLGSSTTTEYTIVCDNRRKKTAISMAYFMKYYSGPLILSLWQERGRKLHPVLNHYIFRVLVYDKLVTFKGNTDVINQPHLFMRPFHFCRKLRNIEYLILSGIEIAGVKLFFYNCMKKDLRIKILFSACLNKNFTLNIRGLVNYNFALYMMGYSWKLNEKNRTELRQVISRGYKNNLKLDIVSKDIFFYSNNPAHINDLYKIFES